MSSTGATAGARIALGGKATVCCVHDREKRKVVTERKVVELGLIHYGKMYDPKQHRIHRCACCENLFVDPADEPLYCETCRTVPVFALGGPITEATGPVDG